MAHIKPLDVTLFIDGQEVQHFEIPLTQEERDFIDDSIRQNRIKEIEQRIRELHEEE